MSKKTALRHCPECEQDLQFNCDIGVTVHERGDAQASMYLCPGGHAVLVVEAARIMEEED